MKRVASTMSTMLIGLLVFVVLCSSTSKGHSPLEVWIPYFPDTSAVKLDYWKENGLSYIGVSIFFPSTGYNITDWGTPITAGNNISANAEIWDWTGVDLPMVIERHHNYCLGDLTAGEYLFTFKTWDLPVRSIRFTVYIVVPDDYSTIQEAINAANPGDTVYVKAGAYYEHVVVNKSLSLVGEDRDSTIIDGNETGFVVRIMWTSHVTISGFTLRRSGRELIHLPIWVSYPESGIFLEEAQECVISNNVIINNLGGATLHRSPNNIIKNNIIMNNEYCISLSTAFTETVNNIIQENTIANNTYGLVFDLNDNWGHSHDNYIYHNNFINNSIQAISFATSSPNIWDAGYPSGGNYWSDYASVDLFSGRYQNETGSDGIGDSPYVIDENNTDQYPLMHPYGSVRNLDTNLTYLTIQSAINAASDGDTVFVRNGTYYENIVVNKSLSLVGEDRYNTVIDGNVAGTGVHVTTDHVTVQGFGVQNCEVGIKVESNDNVISSNLVSSNGYYETELLSDQEVYQDYVSPIHKWYLHNMINGSYTAFFNITDHTPAISVQALGQEDVNQLGIGLFHDKNNDNEPQLQEYVGYMEGKDKNVHVFLVNPPVGQYIIKVLGWEVLGDPGHFNLNITTYTGYGIMFLSSNNNTITENLVTHNPVGLYLYDSHNSTIRLNDAVENVGGIVLSDSRDCVISNNNASSNEFGSGLYQFGIGMTFWSVHDFNISENNMSSSTFGMWLTNSSDNEVIGNDLVSNLGWSLLIYYSHDNTVQYNNISLTGEDGVRMMFSRQNNFTENHFESNGHAGIFFWQNNTNNSITKNKFYSNGQHGVELKLWCNNNTIADNDIRHNERNGILILESTSNMVTRNYVYSNARGVISYLSSDNKIYHNNIINSWEEQAADFNSANIWDNGCEGNYWSNYNGTDLDSDGIGDTYIPWETVDNYPLMNPYWLPGDVNHDLKIDIYDVVRITGVYGSKQGDLNWNPHSDIAEPYGIINIYDVVTCTKDYRKEYTP